MERNIKRDGIVLKKILVGESNIGLTLLTDTDEILFVMAFGAKKSSNKIFEGTGVFSKGRWDLYYDPVKEQYRARDVGIIEYNNHISKEIEGYYLITFFSEIILKSQGSEGVYALLDSSIEALKLKKYRELMVQFLLRFLDFQGLRPDLRKGFEQGVLVYVQKTLKLELSLASKIGLELKSLGKLKDYLIMEIIQHLGFKLNTLDAVTNLIYERPYDLGENRC